jgi:OmcA/MtrC family decaheme c-type cytochrome
VPDGNEFDLSVSGGHTIPVKSEQIQGVNFELIEVEGVSPGGSPAVTFRITEDDGDVIPPANMDYLGVTLARPTSDYITRTTETIFRAPSDTPPAVDELDEGAYRYTLAYTLPQNAEGTYAFGLEGYVMESIEGVEDPVRVPGMNPVVYVALEGGEPQSRRQLVDRELCNACHNDLALHGGFRKSTEYCVLCHNARASDEVVRPEEAMPPTTIHFKVLIHRLHRGEELAQKPYIVYGFQGSVHDFSGLRFPGNLANCETCHLSTTYDLPLPAGVQPTIVTQDGEIVTSILPVQAACTACHDSEAVVGHAELQTSPSGLETCAVCHGPGKEFSVTEVHSE